MWGNRENASRKENVFFKYNWPSILWAAFVLWLSLSPQKGLPLVPIPHFDKAVHFVFYFTLAALLYYGWMNQQVFGSLHRNSFLKILLLASFYGLSIEICQEVFTADRHFSWADETANILGAVSGLWAIRQLIE